MSTPKTPNLAVTGDTVGALVESGAEFLRSAGVSFGHGTTNAHDEAAWLVLWRLGLPLDSDLSDAPDSIKKQPVPRDQIDLVATLFEERTSSRKPAAYLTREAWLQGVPFYVDERAIVP
ncbi:50S ribosomal protein L3 N(5)-glutamine methyltransferase, partial [Acidovorax sp. HMWF029]